MGVLHGEDAYVYRGDNLGRKTASPRGKLGGIRWPQPASRLHANVAKFIIDGAYTREMLPQTREFLRKNGIASVTRWEPAR